MQKDPIFIGAYIVGLGLNRDGIPSVPRKFSPKNPNKKALDVIFITVRDYVEYGTSTRPTMVVATSFFTKIEGEIGGKNRKAIDQAEAEYAKWLEGKEQEPEELIEKHQTRG